MTESPGLNLASKVCMQVTVRHGLTLLTRQSVCTRDNRYFSFQSPTLCPIWRELLFTFVIHQGWICFSSQVSWFSSQNQKTNLNYCVLQSQSTNPFPVLWSMENMFNHERWVGSWSWKMDMAKAIRRSYHYCKSKQKQFSRLAELAKKLQQNWCQR